MTGLGAVVDRELAEAPPRPGPGLPRLSGPVWAARLQALQEYPGRWGRWPGEVTASPVASLVSIGAFTRRLGGTYAFRTSVDDAGVTLICARWTPPAGAVRACRRCGCTDDRACPGGCWWVAADLCSACDDVEVIDLRPAASAAVPAPVDGSRRPSPRPGAGSTSNACRGRFPVGPLERAARLRFPDRRGAGGLGFLAELAGLDRSIVARWRERGLTEDRADQLAVTLGMHPSEIWPDWLPRDPSAAAVTPAGTVASGFQGPEVVGGGTPAPERSAPAAPEPSQGEPQLLRGPTVGRRAGGVGAAPSPPPPLLKCGSCWRRFAEAEALAAHEDFHARVGAVS